MSFQTHRNSNRFSGFNKSESYLYFLNDNRDRFYNVTLVYHIQNLCMYVMTPVEEHVASLVTTPSSIIEESWPHFQFY